MFQKLIIAGNLGRDPEMKFTPDGKAVTTFSVAVSERKDETLWARVTVWDKLAETCSAYLKKGAKVLVEGKLKPDADGNPRTYQRKDGTTGASYEVTASAVRFLSGKDEQEVAI
jgi:single-strand DNA-binding protein